MTIRTRLALGFAALATAVVLLGAASLGHLSALHREVEDLARHRIAQERTVGAMPDPQQPAAARLGADGAAAALLHADRTLAAGRATVAALLVIVCGLVGALGVCVLRASRPIDAGADDQDPVPEPTPPEAPRNPFVDRRGPDRAANVVRPPFGQRSATGRVPGAADDWEAF